MENSPNLESTCMSGNLFKSQEKVQGLSKVKSNMDSQGIWKWKHCCYPDVLNNKVIDSSLEKHTNTSRTESTRLNYN